MALCFALYVREERIRGLPLNIEYSEEAMQLMKSNPYDEIKKEILEGGVTDWFEIKTDSRSNDEDLQSFKRKNDELLKEFGW